MLYLKPCYNELCYTEVCIKLYMGHIKWKSGLEHAQNEGNWSGSALFAIQYVNLYQ